MLGSWVTLTEKTKTFNECELVSNLLSTLTFAIKSVADVTFVDNKENNLKERAISLLFRNMSSNVNETYKKWRDVNNI